MHTHKEGPSQPIINAMTLSPSEKQTFYVNNAIFSDKQRVKL
jgi:hypothetical protein